MSTLAFRPQAKRRTIHLSMTPLIDVLFLLIIFFVLTGTFRRYGKLELSLPDSATAVETRAEDDTGQVELAITESGELFIDEEPIARRELHAALARVRESNPTTRVLINAEAHVDHVDVVALLDAVRDAGFPGVSVGTRIPSARDR